MRNGKRYVKGFLHRKQISPKKVIFHDGIVGDILFLEKFKLNSENSGKFLTEQHDLSEENQLPECLRKTVTL